MSNVKSVVIAGWLPFDWSGNLEPGDAQLVASLFLSPTIGVRLTFGTLRYKPNADGGRTATYMFEVLGSEALNHKLIERLVGIFRKAGTVEEARWRDDEERGGWVEVL